MDGKDTLREADNDSRKLELLDRLELEHELFYYRMVSRPSKEVYNECGCIRFHESIYEYFLYCDGISSRHIRACMEERSIT